MLKYNILWSILKGYKVKKMQQISCGKREKCVILDIVIYNKESIE